MINLQLLLTYRPQLTTPRNTHLTSSDHPIIGGVYFSAFRRGIEWRVVVYNSVNPMGRGAEV
jgi:hypothetical protein